MCCVNVFVKVARDIRHISNMPNIAAFYASLWLWPLQRFDHGHTHAKLCKRTLQDERFSRQVPPVPERLHWLSVLPTKVRTSLKFKDTFNVNWSSLTLNDEPVQWSNWTSSSFRKHDDIQRSSNSDRRKQPFTISESLNFRLSEIVFEFLPLNDRNFCHISYVFSVPRKRDLHCEASYASQWSITTYT